MELHLGDRDGVVDKSLNYECNVKLAGVCDQANPRCRTISFHALLIHYLQIPPDENIATSLNAGHDKDLDIAVKRLFDALPTLKNVRFVLFTQKGSENGIGWYKEL